MFSPFITAGILLIVVYLIPQGFVALPRLIRSRLVERKKGKEAGHAA
jgi:hypothetical protein